MLELSGIDVSYGPVPAVRGVSLRVQKGEIVVLIGGNGAGKSTTLKAIHGLVRPRRGSIRLDGREMSRAVTHQIVASGIALCPEGRQVFPSMTVLENLELGAVALVDRSLVPRQLEQVLALFPRLAERGRQLAGSLSGGEQQMLAIGRALMARPRLLMLDEPSMGLAPLIVRHIFDIIQSINRTGVSILLVEQNAVLGLGIANRGYVLENGRVVLEGAASQLSSDAHVQEAYLGV